MNFTEVNDKNMQLYAFTHYDNPSCVDINEFHEDFAKIKYVKRLLRKGKQSGDIKTRLLFNHLIVLYNVFGYESATVLLFANLDHDLISTLKTLLIFLNYFPQDSANIVDLIGSYVYDIAENNELLKLLDTQYYNDLREKK